MDHLDDEKLIQICKNRTCICPHCFKEKKTPMVSIGVQVNEKNNMISNIVGNSPRALVRPSVGMKYNSSSQLSFQTFKPPKVQKINSLTTKGLQANIMKVYGKPINTNRMGQRFSVMVTATKNNIGSVGMLPNHHQNRQKGFLPRSHTKPFEQEGEDIKEQHSVTSQSDINRSKSKSIEVTEESEEDSEDSEEEEGDIQLSPRKIGFLKKKNFGVENKLTILRAKNSGNKLLLKHVSVQYC